MPPITPPSPKQIVVNYLKVLGVTRIDELIADYAITAHLNAKDVIGIYNYIRTDKLSWAVFKTWVVEVKDKY